MASKDAGTGNVDEPKSKDEEVFKLDGNVLKLVNEALLEYLGPGYKSHIEIAPNAEIVPPLPYFNDKLYSMRVIRIGPDEPHIAPTADSKNLQFLPNLPSHEALHVHYKDDGTVVYEFLIFERNGTRLLSSPYLENSARSGDEIPCKPSLSLNPYLKQKDPKEALVKYFADFFSLGGKPSDDAFKWKQKGPNQDFKISKEIGDTTFYWKFTKIHEKAVVVDNGKESMNVKLNEKVP